MKREKLIQLGRFVLGWALVRGFVVFVVKASFLEFVLKYRVFLLIVSVSYFYYYSIEYEVDKKYDTIRNVIIRGNAYLFAHIFFRPLLNIPHELFVLLGLIVLGIYGTTKMKTRRKGVLQAIGGVFSFFILISGWFYLYPEAPDIEGFLKTRRYEIRVYGASGEVDRREAYMQITNVRRSEDFALMSNFRKILGSDGKISYISMRRERNEKILIISPGGDVVWIYPQSEVRVGFENIDRLKVSKLAGKVGFGSGVFAGDIEYVGDVEPIGEDELHLLEVVKNGYMIELVEYLRDQIADEQISFGNTEIMQDADGVLLRFLAKIFPTTFGQNLRNYNEFQKYFDMIKEDEQLQIDYSVGQTGWNSGGLRDNLKNGINVGRENTRFL